MQSNLCKCGQPRRGLNQGYCKSCHAAYCREHRRLNGITETQRIKSNCRRYTNVYIKRGKLIPGPCEHSGCLNKVQPHHEDYSKPLEVRWLCREHHLLLHKLQREKEKANALGAETNAL